MEIKRRRRYSNRSLYNDVRSTKIIGYGKLTRAQICYKNVIEALSN